ncbi:hypothetical protein DFH09DRAFT_1207315 [Mycena vulgaris]|nr:hypothetical protein DFH09DRAFT_1207315 [Mycena vulgaris]
MSCGSDSRHLYHRVVCLPSHPPRPRRPPRPVALPLRPVLPCRCRSSPSIRVHLHFVGQRNTCAIAHGTASLPAGVAAPVVSTPCRLRHLCMIIARAPCASLPPASGIKLASAPLDRIPPRSARPLSLPPPSSFAPCVPASANLQWRRRIAPLPR